MKRRTKVTIKKSLGFIARAPLGPLGGDLHAGRWPGRGAFVADAADVRADERRRAARRAKGRRC
ncbi:hypothetical protein [Patulibacter minatonensis]|uniref:hypothetical protein n=1 Tax=Patulibacter minatonensis TaxID=298163 RepID=UPI00047D88F8|nr:hypothetical protein [Patulibacter minatonensis]